MGETMQPHDPNPTLDRFEQRDAEKRLYRRLATCAAFGFAVLWLVLGLAVAVVLLSGCVPVPKVQAVSITASMISDPTATAAATPTPLPSPTVIVCQVSTGYDLGTVYVRAGPGMRFPVVGVAREGQRLTIMDLSDAGGWLKIQSGEIEGYFYAARWCAKERE
jgi:hypothetical protein